MLPSQTSQQIIYSEKKFGLLASCSGGKAYHRSYEALKEDL